MAETVAEVVEERTVGTVKATVVRCFGGEVYSVALLDTFGISTCRRTLGPEAPTAERVALMILQHVRYSQVRTGRN